MSYLKKQHIVEQLRSRGHYEQARIVEESDHDSLDFDTAIFAGIAASELLSDFSSSADMPSVESVPDYSGGGGDFGGGGAGGDI